MGLGRHEHDAGVAGQQALDLLQADVAAADDHAAAAGQLQAGDVERGLEHPGHAGLIADPLLQLTDAFLAAVGLGGHGLKGTHRVSANRGERRAADGRSTPGAADVLGAADPAPHSAADGPALHD